MMYKVFLQMKPLGVIFSVSSIFLVVLFILLYKVALTFELADDMCYSCYSNSCYSCVTLQMKATVQYFPMVLLLCPVEVVVTFEFG